MIPHACVANNCPRRKLQYAKITKKKKKKNQRHSAGLTLKHDLCYTLKYLQAMEPHALKITPKPNVPQKFNHDSPT